MKHSLQIIVFLCLHLATAQAMAFTKMLTAAELQAQVAGLFPLQKLTPFMTVTLSDPRVVLDDKSDRIGVELSIATDALGGIASKARGLIDGQLHYESATGEFFLLKPEVRRLHVENIPELYQSDIRMIADEIAKEAFTQIPIYTLKEDDPHQALARSYLKSATVRNGKLVLELDLFKYSE